LGQVPAATRVGPPSVPGSRLGWTRCLGPEGQVKNYFDAHQRLDQTLYKVPGTSAARQAPGHCKLAAGAQTHMGSFLSGPLCFRLRAKAVCKHWQAALAGLPLPELELSTSPSHHDCQVQEWIILTQPPVTKVGLDSISCNTCTLLNSVSRTVRWRRWNFSGRNCH
jgi:hypothetical protein